ncbi:MAG: sulfotransferase domain-containing protein [Chloroflexi bacterium]|nr:sulfotransferase domain-containing protein [Chloroflexota bacterium]
MSKSIRTFTRAAAWKYRQATNRWRAFPHFIVIGAQKSGTSSLFYYLSQHPQVVRSFAKEVHYFDGGLNARIDSFQRGPEWYRAHFPLRVMLKPQQITGEATPLYIFNPWVPERISKLLPDVKLIAVLRNPTDRAISHYFHEQRRGREPLSIAEALRAEDERLKPAVQRGDFKDDVLLHCSYTSRGRYHEQLSRYFKYFARDQLLILSSEELFREPENTLAAVYRFLGIEQPTSRIDFKPLNVA